MKWRDLRRFCAFCTPHRRGEDDGGSVANGREVVTLVDEEKPAGTYKATWYVTHHPSEVYYCRLKADGLLTQKNSDEVNNLLVVFIPKHRLGLLQTHETRPLS